MDFDASRLQAAAALAVHSILPSFTIGLASWLAVLEGLWLGTGDERFRRLYRGWVRTFAAVFGGGVLASLSIPAVSRLELILEIVAFLLEAALVAALLLGWPARARRSHFLATIVLALGSVIFVVTWPGADIPEHLLHLLLAAYLATALMIAAVSAWQLIRDPDHDEARLALKMSVGMLVICAPLQIAAESGEMRAGMRLRAGLAAAVLALGLWGGLLIWRGSPERSRMFLAACVLFSPISVLAAATAWAGHAAATEPS